MKSHHVMNCESWKHVVRFRSQQFQKVMKLPETESWHFKSSHETLGFFNLGFTVQNHFILTMQPVYQTGMLWFYITIMLLLFLASFNTIQNNAYYSFSEAGYLILLKNLPNSDKTSKVRWFFSTWLKVLAKSKGFCENFWFEKKDVLLRGKCFLP